MSPIDRFRKTRDPREAGVYPTSRERNQATCDLLEAFDDARTLTRAAASRLVLVVLRELREDLAVAMNLPTADEIRAAENVLERLGELLAEVDKAEAAEGSDR